MCIKINSGYVPYTSSSMAVFQLLCEYRTVPVFLFCGTIAVPVARGYCMRAGVYVCTWMYSTLCHPVLYTWRGALGAVVNETLAMS